MKVVKVIIKQTRDEKERRKNQKQKEKKITRATLMIAAFYFYNKNYKIACVMVISYFW